MNVLIIATWFPSIESPVNGIFVALQAKALAKRHTITVLAPEIGSPDSALTLHEDTSWPYRVIRANIPAARIGHFWNYAKVIAITTKQYGSDIVHAHVALPGGAAAALAKCLTRKPLVITEHRGPFHNCMKSLRDRIKVKFALNTADSVIAVGNSLKKDIMSYGITRHIEVVPNMIDTSIFKCYENESILSAKREYKLLFVGRLNDDQKNLPSLLRSLAKLNKTGTYRLTIIGGGKFLLPYKQLAEDLKIQAMCNFVGALPSEDILNHLKECDVFVLPSLIETFGIVLAEALGVGRPVVATACGGPGDIVTPETGRLVPVNDDNSLVEAIYDVCAHLPEYEPRRLSEYAHNRFSEEAVADQIGEIYSRILRKNR